MDKPDLIRTLRVQKDGSETLWRNIMAVFLKARIGETMAVHIAYPPKFVGPEPINMRLESVDKESGRAHFSIPLTHIKGLDDDLY
jgi:hypothetical protein